MIRAFRALAWLRWRLLVNGFRKSRRDALERASRLAAVALPAFVAVLAVPSVLTLAAVAFVGGLLAPSSDTARVLMSVVPRALLAVLTFAVLIGPLVRSAQGATLGLARLVLLPIPRRVLHLAEIVAGLADPWILAVLPSLVTLPAGILAAGSPAAAFMVLAAGLAITLVFATLASAASFVVALLLRDRRRGEWVSLVFLAMLSIAGFLPALLSSHRASRGLDRRIETRAHGSADRGVVIDLPAWTRGAPSELYGLALRRGLEGRPSGALLPLAGLAAFAAALYGISWLAYLRLLGSPEGGGRKRGGDRRPPWTLRAPGVPPGVSAVALAEIRLVLRTVRGKTAVFFTPVALGVIAFMGSQGDRIDPGHSPLPALGGAMIPWATAVFSVIALQPFLLNQFATDRSGLTLELLSPLTDRDLVRGKAAGLGVLWLMTFALCSALGIALGPRTGPAYWIAGAIGSASILFLLAPAAATLSALFPKSADLGRIGRAGNPHPTASLAGGLGSVALSLPPAGLAALGFMVFKSGAIAVALVSGWAALALAAGLALLGPAASVVARRRENLALVAEGR